MDATAIVTNLKKNKFFFIMQYLVDIQSFQFNNDTDNVCCANWILNALFNIKSIKLTINTN